MIKLDNDLLSELGLGALPEEEKKKLLAHIYETLEMRVGMKLAEQMSDAQLREFEQFIDRNDEAGALRWLESNFPNYKDVVAAEFDKLKAEIHQTAPQILVASQQHTASNPGQPAGPPVQAQQGPWQTADSVPSNPPNQWQQPGTPNAGYPNPPVDGGQGPSTI